MLCGSLWGVPATPLHVEIYIFANHTNAFFLGGRTFLGQSCFALVRAKRRNFFFHGFLSSSPISCPRSIFGGVPLSLAHTLFLVYFLFTLSLNAFNKNNKLDKTKKMCYNYFAWTGKDILLGGSVLRGAKRAERMPLVEKKTVF